MMKALHRTTSRVACLPATDLSLDRNKRGAELQARGMVRHLRVGTVGGKLYVWKPELGGRPRRILASNSPAFRAALRRNRFIWASFVAGPRTQSSSSMERATGNDVGKFHFAPSLGRALGLDGTSPDYFHDHEWTRGPSGQLRLRTPVTLVASLPNSGTTWFLYVLQYAQQTHVGTAAIQSDILHPMCNALLTSEISKTMGAPEDNSWLHIFQPTPSSAAVDLLLEMATDSMHTKAVFELQYMRQHGASIVGEVLPKHLVWPWQGIVDPQNDATSIKLLLSKEVINVFSLVQHMEMNHATGGQPSVDVIGLYRHRAHMFPMSNKSAMLCKECMLQKIVQSFEVNHFPSDASLIGLQRWWRRRAGHVGGRQSACGLVFAHLLIWYTVLRAVPAGMTIVDYARLMLFDRRQLREYLAVSLPPSLLESPGVVALASSIDANRFEKPREFLQKRERLYAKLGVEPFALKAIAEMRRLDPLTDLSLLLQPPHLD